MLKRVIIFAIISVLVGLVIIPLVVNWLFMQTSSCDILVAKWDADDALLYVSGILTFIGTVILGYVSYIQTKKSNSIAQVSLDLAKKSNELGVITRIIEREIDNYNDLRRELDEISEICLPQSILKIPVNMIDEQGKISIEDTIKAIEQKNRIMDLFIRISRILRQDKKFKHNDNDPFKQVFTKVYLMSYDYIEYHTQNEFLQNKTPYDIRKIDTYQALYEEFMKKREKYLLERENILDKLLYEEHTLQEVREICNK